MMERSRACGCACRYSLHFVTKKLPLTPRARYVVLQALRGGVTCVQIRDPEASVTAIYQAACWLKARMWQFPHAHLIVNNYAAVAHHLDIGLHIGQQDLPYPVARELLGPHAIIGLTLEKMGDAKEAADWDVDYVGVGAFASQSKPAFKSLGLDQIAALRTWFPKPLVGIGGIRLENAMQVLKAGAHGLAVGTAIADAPCPKKAARTLRSLLKLGRIP